MFIGNRSQCDYIVAILFFEFLAIFNNENLPNGKNYFAKVGGSKFYQTLKNE